MNGLDARALARFEAKYEAGPGCWEWAAFVNPWGYGMFRLRHQESMKLAHRVAYEHFVGPIPDGYEVDHLCRNRACVNPAHLEAVTSAENMRRSTLPERRGLHNAGKERCPRDHPYDEANTYVTPGGDRQCRECRRMHRRASAARRMAVA